MPLYLDWKDIATRLVLTVLACGILGWERGEGDRAAGMRTTLIVGLAAAIAMIQTNMLLLMTGKTSDSFAVADVMRLPLGILTGVGFIGAGAILRRNERVVGLTTAATLWFVTVVGLCFGGGQLALGLVSSLLALFILHGLKALDSYRRLERRLRLRVTWRLDDLEEADLRQMLTAENLGLASWKVNYDLDHKIAALRCDLKWLTSANNYNVPDLLKKMSRQPGIIRLSWSL
ncbi:MAG TPA: MgtC/SapB family protein [Dongiaceae bacterium]|nr:MgtC/SapB family protein [Dongiaceae bacterium]